MDEKTVRKDIEEAKSGADGSAPEPPDPPLEVKGKDGRTYDTAKLSKPKPTAPVVRRLARNGGSEGRQSAAGGREAEGGEKHSHHRG